MGVLMIKRNIRKRANGFFTNFSYSGEMEFDLSSGQARIRFLTSGILIPKSDVIIDAWLLAGGGAGGRKSGTTYMGSGGGSGYTVTEKGIVLKANQEYEIVIGAGGIPGTASSLSYTGGSTKAFGFTAGGGWHAGRRMLIGGHYEVFASIGGDGSSGGGVGSMEYGYSGGMGGSDGADGNGDSNTSYDVNEKPGRGMGISTTEFGEGTGRLYAAGGSGGSHDGTIVPGATGGGGATGADGEPNTGSGGGGEGAIIGADGVVSYIGPGSGGSGIVVIRKAVN